MKNTMTEPANTKKLFKILVGAAWIDGRVQPEERKYLNRIAQEQGIANDPEIHPLLHEIVAVKPDQCYTWIQEYLGERPNSQDCQRLIEATSALVYSDGEMAVEEAKLLSRIQRLDPGSEQPEPVHDAVLRTIRKLYRRWMTQQN
jgi:uncharacterized tellurite resistance protein B-like protein